MSEYRNIKMVRSLVLQWVVVFIASASETPSVAAQFISYRWGQMALRQDLYDSALHVDQQVMSCIARTAASGGGVSTAGASPVSVLQTKWQSSDLLMAAIVVGGRQRCKQEDKACWSLPKVWETRGATHIADAGIMERRSRSRHASWRLYYLFQLAPRV